MSTIPTQFLRHLRATLLLSFFLAGCSKPETPPPEPAPSISGQVVSFPGQKEPLGIRVAVVGNSGEQVLAIPGRLAWDEDRTTRVFAPYSGRLDRMRVALGASVRRGQPLADIASSDIGQAQADLHKAEADLALTRAASERARDLAEAGVIAVKDRQQAQADYARSQAESARAHARLAQYGVAANGVTQALTLAAPLSGIVVERNGNPGMEVRNDAQGAPLYTISDPSSLSVVLDIDETLIAAFKPGQIVSLRTVAWPDATFKATVLSVGASVDPASRTVKIRARVANPDQRLKAEMFVTANLKQPSALPLLPADAVFLRGDKPCVFVQLGSGRFERREVKVRGAGPQSWLVTEGVATGERVVIGGNLFLNQLLDAAK